MGGKTGMESDLKGSISPGPGSYEKKSTVMGIPSMK